MSELCPHCGRVAQQVSKNCLYCGKPLSAEGAPESVTPAGDKAASTPPSEPPAPPVTRPSNGDEVPEPGPPPLPAETPELPHLPLGEFPPRTTIISGNT